MKKKEKDKNIAEVGKKYDLKLILLHGSYASGKNRFGSDLDIAILGKKPVKFDELLTIYSDLANIFGNNLQQELDVKSLHKTDPLFCYQVANNSKLLYGKLIDYSEFKAYAFSNFFDSRDLFKLEKILIDKFQKYLNKKYA